MSFPAERSLCRRFASGCFIYTQKTSPPPLHVRPQYTSQKKKKKKKWSLIPERERKSRYLIFLGGLHFTLHFACEKEEEEKKKTVG